MKTIESRAWRAAEILDFPAPADGAAREVTVSMSSELPYARMRWGDDGPERFLEVLGHGDGEVDLSRIDRGATPVLKDHRNEIDAQVGTVVAAWVENGRGMARLRFAGHPVAAALAERVAAGDVTNVSVGYEIEAARADGESGGLPVVRVTRWVPREVSFVAVPADPTVGHGRADGDGPALVQVSPDSPKKEDPPMSDDTQTAAPATETRAAAPAPAAPTDHAGRDVAAALTAERSRVADIETVAQRFDLPAEMVRKARDTGMSAEAFNRAALDHLGSHEATAARSAKAEIGLTDRDKRQFSFVRLARAMMDPAHVKDAGFELEVARAGAAAKRSARSEYSIPADILLDAGYAARAAGPNALVTGVAADGGALVSTDYRAGSFIDLLRNRLSIMQAGVTMLTGLEGPVDIPKQTGASTVSWVGEGQDATTSKPAVGLVTLVPHTMAIETEYTRRMLMQASPDVEAMLRRDMVAQAALALDAVALNGSADVDAPSGIADYVATTNWATPSTVTFAEFVDMETRVAAANADAGAMRYIYNAVTSGAAKTTEIATGTARFIENGGEVNGYGRIRSNQAGDYVAFFGDFSSVVLGMWSGLDFQVDPFTKGASGGVVLRGFQDVDVQMRHVASVTRNANT